MTKTILTLLVSLTLVQCVSEAQMTEAELDSLVNKARSENLNGSTLVTGWYYITNEVNGFKRILDKESETYYIDPQPIVLKENFDNLEIFETDFSGEFEDYIGLKIILDQQGTLRWADATKKSMYQRLGLIIDDKLVNAPEVNAQILNGMTVINRTVYNRDDLEEFEKKLVR